MNQHFILGEIRDYLEDFHDLFPHVHLDILRELVTAVRRKNVDPEIQLRQFLQAFNDTTTFRKSLDSLDPDTKKIVEAFRDGASAHAVTETKGFHLPPSPPAKHHFRLLDRVHALFHSHDNEEEPHSKAVSTDGSTHAAADVLIYEDADQRKIMKVWCREF